MLAVDASRRNVSAPHLERQTFSGVARNFRQGVRQPVSFIPIHACSAAVPSRPYNQKTSWCMNSCTSLSTGLS